jgi:NAD(P)-dependent dehydrogenase (short-subunit alcohol dehydrogenase family)
MSAIEKRTPVTLVLGATGGIGSELVRTLESAGGAVAASSRNEERLNAADMQAAAGRYAIDATDASSVERVASSVAETAGRLDGIVNCVGSLLLKPAHLTTPEDWQQTLATNLGSAFNAVRAAGRVMRDGGSVVLVSSAAARVGLANHEAIAAAKAGIQGLALAAAATYASRNLRFNVIAPGLVRTPLTERITSKPSAVRASASMHALGRIGEPAEVARMMAWLLDPQQSWITGQTFGVDGGLSTVRAALEGGPAGAASRGARR